jgi:23S rRNA pseudouridine2605 synthase
MRINKFVALSTGLSRRAADAVIEQGKVLVNDTLVSAGYDVTDSDNVTLDGQAITPAVKTTILFNKPAGYVVSRDGQGSQTIYDLLPEQYHHLKPVGRLDKDSSGLLLLTNDGDLANELTHPSRQKTKIYEVELDRPLEPLHQQMISDHGVMLDDGVSKFQVQKQKSGYLVTMTEGRNRQIRRTFWSLGYTVTKLHRIQFGTYNLANIEQPEAFQIIT